MIPSDHFVRMYNELFKMLEEKGHDSLQQYWLQVADLQRSLLSPYIVKDGLKGFYDYWEHIRVEENCDAVLKLTDDYFEFVMKKCPSLTKILDNDADAFPLYCDHCAGWIQPVVSGFGYFYVCDMISRTEPVCAMRIYKDEMKARDYENKVSLLARPYENK